VISATDEYLTLAAPCQAELTEQRSRSHGYAAPCASQAHFRDLLAHAMIAWPGASHYCYACRLGFPSHPLEHHSDAGEPSGSAGPPIAGALASRNLWNTALIVARYFGGVKLGIPGLILAYRRIACLTLDAGQIVPRRPMCSRTFSMSYAAYNLLEHHLKKLGGAWRNTIFAADVRATARLPRAHADAFDHAARAAGPLPAPGCPTWQNE